MTAREEIEFWKNQHHKIKSDGERVELFSKIEKTILEKKDSEFEEHLNAFKSSISDFKEEVNEKIKNKSQLKVYPTSLEELELLKSLFSKMNIRFDLG